MDVRVALGAAQKLSVDVGNMGYRLAVLESHCELLVELASQLRPAEWRRMEQRSLVSDPDEVVLANPAQTLIIEGDQVLLLDEVLRSIQSLR